MGRRGERERERGVCWRKKESEGEGGKEGKREIDNKYILTYQLMYLETEVKVRST